MADPAQSSPLTATAPAKPAQPTQGQPAAEAAPFRLEALTDRTLHFLANASNEALGACLAALGATTYLVLGRVGLVLMGVVGGVVLHASWEGTAHSHGQDPARRRDSRRRELGVEILHRVLDWRDSSTTHSKTPSEEPNVHVQLYSGNGLDFSGFQPETAAALTDFTDAIIRDYVTWWYSPILPSDQSFPASCRRTLTAFLLSASTHLSRKRPADTFVDFVTNSSSIMIVFFNELSAALAATPGAPPSEAIDAYLEAKPDSNLSNVLDTKHQEKKLDVVAEDILQSFLEPKMYNCRPAQTFLKEVLARIVLEMTIASCSKPDWINEWIVSLLEEGEPELMTAIDAGVEGSSATPVPQSKGFADLPEEAPKPASAGHDRTRTKEHKRVVSRAQEAMDDAMREAQRLSAMIAEEDAKKSRTHKSASSISIHDDVSESMTQSVCTPTSSQSDAIAEPHGSELTVSTAASEAADCYPQATAMHEDKLQRSFTSFDQILPSQPPTALMANGSEKPPPLTLFNANIVLSDDAMPTEKGVIKNKPTTEYLIQIEPSSSHHSGWMTARKLVDFETLHEILRRIAPIAGALGFTEGHAALPAWKGHTKASLRGELERYLNDAVGFKPLAESEGMKRFLEKDPGVNRSPSATKGGLSGIGWPGQTFENMGKGMVDVLTKAPKEVAGGGKALFGGVAGVFGNVASPLAGNKKNSASSSSTNLGRSVTSPAQRHGRAESTVPELPAHIRTESSLTFAKRSSQDSLRASSPIVDMQPAPMLQMDRRPSSTPEGDGKQSSRSSLHARSRDHSRAPSMRESVDLSSVHGGDQILTLPPLPTDIPDDYGSAPAANGLSQSPMRDSFLDRASSRASTAPLSIPQSADGVPPLPPRRTSTASTSSTAPLKQPVTPAVSARPKTYPPLTEQETTVIIELFFAVINELYTMSSAWQIRRTLLNAAKTFLLRPGNPQLESIRQLLQTTALDDNTSDAGLAQHIRAVRAAALPTADERGQWPASRSAAEQEKLRVKARRLLVERGMPQALTSVMGAAASGEALGRVFDCFQVERVARGLVFGLVLQGLRAVTQ